MDFDYREMVSRISTAMRSLLNIEQVVAFMRDIAENVLYAGTSYVMLLNQGDKRLRMRNRWLFRIIFASPKNL